MKNRIVHWTDPDYLEKFYEHFGSGQSLSGRQAVHIGRSLKNARVDHQEPQQEPDSSRPSSKSTED